MDERMLSIRELAREAGVSSKTLRYWETRGLLPPPRRTHTNYRLYGETDLERVLFIRKAQSLGFTLAEIRQVFDLARSRKAPCDAVIRWTREKVRALEQQLRMLRDLKGRLTRYNGSGRPSGDPLSSGRTRSAAASRPSLSRIYGS